MATIPIAEFRRTCLGLLEDLPPEGLTVMHKDQPVATFASRRKGLLDFLGCLPDLRVDPNDDLFSTGIKWDAESGHEYSSSRRR